MPTFQGHISEEGVLELIAYILSLPARRPAPGAAADEPQPRPETAPARRRAGPSSGSLPTKGKEPVAMSAELTPPLAETPPRATYLNAGYGVK